MASLSSPGKSATYSATKSSTTSNAKNKSALHGPWQIREASIRSELYRRLTGIFPHLFIKTEHEERGSRSRVDFIIPEKRWAIEVLYIGAARDIIEHAKRCLPEKRYGRIAIIAEYIVLNFCHGPAKKHVDLRKTGMNRVQRSCLFSTLLHLMCSTELQQVEKVFLRTYQVIINDDHWVQVHDANHKLMDSLRIKADRNPAR